MPWYRFEKFYQGGSHHDFVFLTPWEGKKRIEKKQLQQEMQDWGERTSGGHNYGYRVYAKYTKRVPIKILIKRLESAKRMEANLKNQHQEDYKNARKRINFYIKEVEKRTNR